MSAWSCASDVFAWVHVPVSFTWSTPAALHMIPTNHTTQRKMKQGRGQNQKVNQKVKKCQAKQSTEEHKEQTKKQNKNRNYQNSSSKSGSQLLFYASLCPWIRHRYTASLKVTIKTVPNECMVVWHLQYLGRGSLLDTCNTLGMPCCCFIYACDTLVVSWFFGRDTLGVQSLRAMLFFYTPAGGFLVRLWLCEQSTSILKSVQGVYCDGLTCKS